MPIYILLSRLTQQGVQTLRSNPERLRRVNADVEELGARVLHQWATLGEFDFVNVVEAPDIATVAKISIALGGIATLAIVFLLSKYVLVLLLQGQADVAVRTALFLGDLVLSPLVFVGSALLYLDQRARLDADEGLGLTDAPLHPPVDAVDAGRPDAQGEPGPAAGSQS